MRIGLTSTILLAIFFVSQVCCLLSSYNSSFHMFLGSAVAVERIFSSGRDTISVHYASVQLETIHTLMVLKHHLCQMHENNVIMLE